MSSRRKNKQRNHRTSRREDSTPNPPPVRSPWRVRSILGLVGSFVVGMLLASSIVIPMKSGQEEANEDSQSHHTLRYDPSPTRVMDVDRDVVNLAVSELLSFSDAELESLDPVLINLAVVRKLPEYANVEVDRYVKTIDEWADRVERTNALALERGVSSDPLFQYDPDLWACGGMAIALAGESIGIEYTRDVLDPGDPSQTFLPGIIDTKQGTCANMPVLYLAIAHRLGWPLKGVVSRDHFWVRWDDGEKQFNLEATNAAAEGDGVGAFTSAPDETYIDELRTPQVAVESGSDLTSLTARQTLGVYLQSRAGYWAAHDEWAKAEHDLLLARTCFPENRDIYMFLLEAMAKRASGIFDPTERNWLAQSFLIDSNNFMASTDHADTVSGNRGGRRWSSGASQGAGPGDQYRLKQRRQAEVDRINRENMERLERLATDDQDSPPGDQ